jgi:hypothetical protein
LLAAGLGLSAPAAFAQTDISLQAGADHYRTSGEGECKAAPRASIYGVDAALYSVSHRAGKQSFNFTLWQPKDGAPNMMSLQLATGSKNYLVDTVKAGSKRDTKGSGKASVEKSGAGGAIVIDAVAASGEKISGKIQCRAFSGVHAEGG